MGGGRCRTEAHGHRPGACRPQGVGESGDETCADGSRRGERSIRAAIPGGRAGVGTRSQSHQHVRRRDRYRPPAGGDRYPHHGSLAARAAAREEALWARFRVHRRWPGRGGDCRGAMSDILVTAIGAIALYLFAGLRVLREYERGVYFLLGHLRPTKGPGLIFLPPLLAKVERVSLRVMAIDIPPQDVITRDNISIKVHAVLYMRVKTPDKAVVGVENYLYATSQLAQTTLRSVLGETEMDELLANRDKINAILRQITDKRSEDWGIEVSAVEVEDVDLPPEMKRAMARQAAAERERRATLGKDVGIPNRYLQQALLEEQTRTLVETGGGTGFWAWLTGPRSLAAQRVVPGDRVTVEQALARWMEEEESLQVKRRYPDHTTWEPKAGAVASIQRAL